MQWLRIDTSLLWRDLHEPRAHFQPMARQHCENAGCEQVPGRRDRAYAGRPEHHGLQPLRGTRCSNNCVQGAALNFLLFGDGDGDEYLKRRNPDVTAGRAA